MWRDPQNTLPTEKGDCLIVRRFDDPTFFGIEIAFWDGLRWRDMGIDITPSVIAWHPLPDLPPWAKS